MQAGTGLHRRAFNLVKGFARRFDHGHVAGLHEPLASLNRCAAFKTVMSLALGARQACEGTPATVVVDGSDLPRPKYIKHHAQLAVRVKVQQPAAIRRAGLHGTVTRVWHLPTRAHQGRQCAGHPRSACAGGCATTREQTRLRQEVVEVRVSEGGCGGHKVACVLRTAVRSFFRRPDGAHGVTASPNKPQRCVSCAPCGSANAAARKAARSAAASIRPCSNSAARNNLSNFDCPRAWVSL